MTAIGRAATTDDEGTLRVELRSVNNRYLDCSVRLPRALSCLEERIKPYLQSRGISRGKIDVQIGFEAARPDEGVAQLNDEAAREYLSALFRLRDEYGLRDDISVMSVAQNPALFAPPRDDGDDGEEVAEHAWQRLLPVLDEATDQFLAARRREGARLREDLLAKADGIAAAVDRIEALSAEDVSGYRYRLEERLRTVLDEYRVRADEARLLTECAVFADKVAVDEELVRLRSHFVLFRQLMDSDEAVGRRLDFLLQEMNREINTTGSKCANAEIAHLVVHVKNELEKIREQVQNLE